MNCCNYTDASIYFNCSTKTIKKLFFTALGIVTYFYNDFWQGRKYWTADRLRKEVPSEYAILFGDFQGRLVATCDGKDFRLCQLRDHLLSTYSYSVKNKFNSIRTLMFGTISGMPILSLPADGMFSTGRHNDCNTFDYFLLNNVEEIGTVLPLGK